MFNTCFKISVVKEFVPTIFKTSLAKMNEPLRAQQNCKEANVTKREVLTIHAPLHKLEKRKQVDPPEQASKMANESNLANSKISEVYNHANYEKTKLFRVIRLVSNKNTAIVSRVPPPWREKSPSFSVNEQGLLFMDNRKRSQGKRKS